jgi:hypothetical protein
MQSAREAITWVNWGVDPLEFSVQTWRSDLSPTSLTTRSDTCLSIEDALTWKNYAQPWCDSLAFWGRDSHAGWSVSAMGHSSRIRS